MAVHKGEQLIGVKCRSFGDFGVIEMLPVNLVEVKPHKFEPEKRLYSFDGSKYFADEENISKLAEAADSAGVKIQFHLPDGDFGALLTAARREHWPRMMNRFELFSKIVEDNGFRREATFHPPFVRLADLVFTDVARGLAEGAEFHKQVSQAVEEGRIGLKLGMENMGDPNEHSEILGYEFSHFTTLLAEAPAIGITFDTGHRRLSERLSFRELLGFLESRNQSDFIALHFHGNMGRTQFRTHEDDLHLTPDPTNVKGYQRHLQRLKEKKTPLVLEVNLDQHSVDSVRMKLEELWAAAEGRTFV
ncbi:sugar phosphate isomerase/epimerase [Candidatus Micrarchaeota archaeon]|nr:sugar phosphate isomerase/epimerase [Candidatus Micrarchaeota archaeon]